MKFAAKELNRNAKKCDKEEKVEKVKIKKVSNNMDIFYIQNEKLL